jgi:hypothetical protein
MKSGRGDVGNQTFMPHVRQQKRRTRIYAGKEGIDFVRCRICGDHRRVISGRHLSKHGIDRETYMEEYCLRPDELIAKAFRVIQSSRRDYLPYGKSDWIEAIKKLYKRNGSVFARDLQDNHPQIYSQGVWLLGDWDKALSAAGFNPESMRLRKLWDEDKLAKGIRRLRDQKLPLNAKYVMKNHRKLFDGALRRYGSWPKALFTVLGRKHLPDKLFQSRLVLLRALRDALEKNTKFDVPQSLRLQSEYYFGSLDKAIVVLKNDKRILRGWSERKIIKVISKMHRSKESLAYAKVRRTFPALASAAESYFGSWGKALYVAGIDPNLYFVHHTWRKSKRSDKRRPGSGLTPQHMVSGAHL